MAQAQPRKTIGGPSASQHRAPQFGQALLDWWKHLASWWILTICNKAASLKFQ